MTIMNVRSNNKSYVPSFKFVCFDERQGHRTIMIPPFLVAPETIKTIHN